MVAHCWRWTHLRPSTRQPQLGLETLREDSCVTVKVVSIRRGRRKKYRVHVALTQACPEALYAACAPRLGVRGGPTWPGESRRVPLTQGPIRRLATLESGVRVGKISPNKIPQGQGPVFRRPPALELAPVQELRCQGHSDMKTIYTIGSNDASVGPRTRMNPGKSASTVPRWLQRREDHRETSGGSGSLVVPLQGGDLRVRIASERAELEEAFELLATHSRGRGDNCPDAARYGFTPYHVLPGTLTLVAALRRSGLRHDVAGA